MSKELQIVGFRIGDECFGLPIRLVQEIVRVPKITGVPQCADYVQGVMNLRGRIVPVIDLRRRFGIEAAGKASKNRVLVVEVDAHTVGLLVDSASEVLKISDAQVAAPPNVFADASANYVTGVAQHQGRLIILVDLGKILQPGELRLPVHDSM